MTVTVSLEQHVSHPAKPHRSQRSVTLPKRHGVATEVQGLGPPLTTETTGDSCESTTWAPAGRSEPVETGLP